MKKKSKGYTKPKIIHKGELKQFTGSPFPCPTPPWPCDGCND